MRARFVVGCLFSAMLLIAACGHRSMVVLVPDPDGAVGAITVSNDAGTVAIDEANQATVIRGTNIPPAPPSRTEPAEIDRLFGDVLSRQPLPPVHFILHFESDSEELLPASRSQVPDIISAIVKRAPTRVSVVGHTDTMGDEDYNLKLSMRRAQAVKDLLVAGGVDVGTIDVSSHGEGNPIVKTADNVANAENRRVEVIVR